MDKFKYSLMVKHDNSEVINIFSSEDIVNASPTRVLNEVSYEFC